MYLMGAVAIGACCGVLAAEYILYKVHMQTLKKLTKTEVTYNFIPLDIDYSEEPSDKTKH